MVNIPFPNISGNTSAEKIEQLIVYLIQLKEELEYILSNISLDNLSSDVIEKIESANVNIKKTENTQEEQIQQLLNYVLTVDDVLNSKSFNNILEELEARVNAYTDEKIGELGGTE